MTRRSCLLGLAAQAQGGGGQSGGGVLSKPAALRPGDAVGLITPSTFVSDPDQLATVERTIRHFGLKAKYGGNVKKRTGYLGGSVAERVGDLHEMFTDPEVKGVFAIRGGYGSAQLLDKIDYGLIARNPKVFVGYSDITAMHLALQRHAKLVTFHGPVPLSKFTAYTQESFRKALFEPKPIGVLRNPKESNPLRPEHTLRTVRPGKARGLLAGGNLTLLSTTLGTPYEVETKGKIFFIEDVDEQPYSIDRMLTHLRLAGKFDGVAGVVFGECADCKPRDFKPSFTSTYSLGEVVDNILGELKVPVLAGLTIGHTDDQLTLPVGVMASLDAEKGELEIEEAATR